MSSTLTVTNLTATNLTDGAGTTSTFANVASGTAKAWVNFDGTGTIAARDSFNLSSLTDLGEGRYKTTVSNAMSGTSYMVLATAGNELSDYATQNDTDDHIAFLGARTSTEQSVFSADHDDGIQDDCQAMNLSVFGDLA